MEDMNSLLSVIKSVDKSRLSETDRVRLANETAKLQMRLETPWELLFRFSSSYPATSAALKICADLRLFQKWNEKEKTVLTIDEMSSMTGADSELLERLFRHLAAMYLVEQHGPQQYGQTPFIHALGESRYDETVDFLYLLALPSFQNYPKFIKSNNYRNPTDQSNTNWQDIYGPENTAFKWLGADPSRIRIFQRFMDNYSAGKPFLPELYPLSEIARDAKSDRPFLIDIGGGAGHDTEKINRVLPQLPAKALVLQDLPEVVKDLRLDAKIDVQPHSFFNAQPVHGAAIYYFHTVIHNWSHDESVQILKNIAAAMEKGYSRILIQDVVMGAENPKPMFTTVDLCMSAIMSAGEKTEVMWTKAIEEAGLKVQKIWKLPEEQSKTVEEVIEAVLP